MSNKPHRYFKNPQEGVTKFTPKTRFPSKPEEVEVEKNYTLKRNELNRSLGEFYKGKSNRDARRNKELQIPAQIDLIKINFHDIFDSSKYENIYREDFGLSTLRFTEFNTVGLFAITDKIKFDLFISDIVKFINDKPNFNNNIIFIKEFTFYSSNQIINYRVLKPHVVLDIADNVEIFQDYIIPIERKLLEYLKERNIKFYFDEKYPSKIELLNVAESIIIEIADNFDIIQSINSYSSGVVRPNKLNVAEKSYGFEITNCDENLPIIGVIDTGISGETPLKGLIVDDSYFNLTSSPTNVDEEDHGTAVAALAALGKKLYPSNVGSFKADAKLLSIKTLDGKIGHIVESEVIRLIREAHLRHGVQIFTLTIGYADSKLDNEIVSEYAYALDILSYELNILIFIAIGNSKLLTSSGDVVSYPFHFENESTNLCSPAESMNNLTVGAIASNLEDNDIQRISPPGLVPAIYSRSCHNNWQHEALKNKNGKTDWTKANKKLFKPDVCNYGGEFDTQGYPTITGINVLSAKKGIYFNREVGTSYSTPLTANLAARIIKTYPELTGNMQTVKALIINSSENNEIGNALDGLRILTHHSVLGHGVPKDEKCLYSSDDRITIILEDVIQPDQIKSYALNIPPYLLESDKKNGLLKVKATLCFKFTPLKHHHLAYCPFHIAFGVTRNLPLSRINNNKAKEVFFGESSWSEDYYYKRKILSNTQKISFTVSKKVLEEEKCNLKIAVNAKLHKLLNDLDKSKLVETNIEFSIVFTIEENPIKNLNTGRLYDELIAHNTLEILLNNEADLEAEASI
jgi:Subtilase family